MEIELHQLDQRYEALRRRDGRRERTLLASLSEIGQQAPVVVVRGEGDRFVLVDGYKRVRALSRLSRDTVSIIVWELREAEALLLAQVMRSADAATALEESWLLRELRDRFGLTAVELAQRFDKSASWVSRRLALVEELPEVVQELVRAGKLVAHAAMKHLVPLARANREGCLKLAPALAEHRLSSRQVGALCTAFCAGTEETRALILASPLVVLRAQAAAQEPKDKTPAQRLLSDLGALAGIARRARQLVDNEFTEDRARGRRLAAPLCACGRARRDGRAVHRDSAGGEQCWTNRSARRSSRCMSRSTACGPSPACWRSPAARSAACCARRARRCRGSSGRSWRASTRRRSARSTYRARESGASA